MTTKIVLWKDNRLSQRFEVPADALLAGYRSYIEPPTRRERHQYVGTLRSLMEYIGAPEADGGLQATFAGPWMRGEAGKAEELSCDQRAWDDIETRAQGLLFDE